MDSNEDKDGCEGIDGSYDKVLEGQLKKTIKGSKKHFGMPGYGAIFDMSDKKKIPKVRSSHLRVAFFKCYFSRVNGSKVDRRSEETLRLFAKLFFYHQEIRIETRDIFDRFNENLLERNEYSVLKEYLKQMVLDGCSTISNIPIPAADLKKFPKRDDFEDEEQFYLAAENFCKGTDHVEITFNPKRRDFPTPDEIFLKIADVEADAIEKKNDKRFISLSERDHSINNYLTISSKNRKLWDQAFALIVLDAIEELEQEIRSFGVLDAYTPQPQIKTAIDHFNQTYPRAKEMDNNEKAYSISLRYKEKKDDNLGNPFVRESILRHLNRG